MDFDAYDYLEKTVVEEKEDRDSKKSKSKSKENSERSYRKREVDQEEPALPDGDDRRSKRSRATADEENGSDKKEKDRDRDRDRDRERERERERSGHREKDRHHRDSDREKDRERERSSREKEKDKDKDKERDKEREKERRERDKEKERERERKERDHRKEKEEKERSRRSRSRSERDRDRDRDRERERERDLEIRDTRRFKDKKEVVEPEADPERDQRTVFAYQMPLKANERDVYEFFSKAGKVRDVRLIMDRNSRRSKGVGYIEFYDAMSVPMAIALSGNLLLGQPVMVKPSEAEKNLVQSTASTGGSSGLAGPYGAVDRKLYVGNLHFNMTESQLRAIFEPFGPVELVQLPLDLETGHCKGFGFVQFAKLEDAKAAQSLNGKVEIAGRTIKVSSVTEHVGTQDTGAKSADFDDDDGGGLSLNAQSRALLMQKLDRSGIATSIAESLGAPVVNGPAPNAQAMGLPINGQAAVSVPALPAQALLTPAAEPVGTPSECLLLKNMFDPATETDPDFDMDIKDDVEEECSKYGRVKHIYVDRNSAGCVYLRFETVEGAMGAQRAMHMRWFACRSISALYMQPHVYEAKFNVGA
ncbi:RNA-binding protein 39 [Quercus lobata]|uniref:RNA-binding protein 39 n=1 Tax=Quercus lobata TaxID=97700 RepID=UPI0012462691|nr:RNA-binding protein 39 [Quercus lobata]